MSRLTFTGGSNSDPVWAPDGKHLVFRSRVGQKWVMWWIRTDGAGEPQRLLEPDHRVEDLSAQSFTPDGRQIVYAEFNPVTRTDLWVLRLDGSDPEHPTAKREPLLRTAAQETRPAISPDGRWLAYVSNESGVPEVYVRPFPMTPSGSGGKWQISIGGGVTPVWSQNGRELLYLSLDSHLMTTEYTTSGESFLPTKPRVWSSRRLLVPGFTNYDLAPDGARVAGFPRPDTQSDDAYRVTLLLNFLDTLPRR